MADARGAADGATLHGNLLLRLGQAAPIQCSNKQSWPSEQILQEIVGSRHEVLRVGGAK